MRRSSPSVQIVGDEGALGALRQRRLDHRVAAAADRETRAVVDGGACPPAGECEFGQRRRDVEHGDGAGGQRDRLGAGDHLLRQFVEQREFQGERLVGGMGDPALQVAEFDRRIALGADHRLPQDERRRRPGRQALGVLGRDLDEETQHGVVPDLEALDPGFSHVARLQLGDQPPALVAQAAQLVQLLPVALGDEAAVANRERQIRGQRCVQQPDEFAVLAQVLHCSGDAGRRRTAQAGVGGEITQVAGGRERVADRREIARAAAAQRDPRQRALRVRTALQGFTHGGAQPLAIDEHADHVEPPVDSHRIGQRRRQPRQQQPGAGAGNGAVDDTDQAALALAGERAGQLQVAASGAVDLHGSPGRQTTRRRESRQATLLRQLDVVDERAERRHFRRRERAEPVERLDAEHRLQPAAAGRLVETARRQRRQPSAPLGGAAGEWFLLQQPVRQQQLARIEPRQRRREIDVGDRLRLQFAGRDVDPGDRQPARCFRQRRQVVRAAGVEQRILGECAGGDHADDIARHHRLAAALLRLRRIFRLLAHRHLEAGADQPGDVPLVAVHRHARHRDVLTVVLAAAGQRDIQGGRRPHRVVEEQLVEVTHPVEQQAAGMPALDRPVLRHQRRRRGHRRSDTDRAPVLRSGRRLHHRWAGVGGRHDLWREVSGMPETSVAISAVSFAGS